MFEDEIDALQPQVDKLITLGVNKIIALGHSGFVTDKEIAKRVKGVDVVIGGHSNTFLYTGTVCIVYHRVLLFNTYNYSNFICQPGLSLSLGTRLQS